MDRVANLEVTGNIVSATLVTRDIAEANMLIRAIKSEIETYAIDVVIFDVNTSSRHDEIIALRLGQLVIDHARFKAPDVDNFRSRIDCVGPKEFTTDDIPELPFKFRTPITTLKTGERITCSVIVKRGQAKTHVKWRPVGPIKMTEVENGYRISFKEIGMLTGREIFEKGFEKIGDAAHRPPINLFSHPLVPANIQ